MVESLVISVFVVVVVLCMAARIDMWRGAMSEVETFLRCWMEENDLTLLGSRPGLDPWMDVLGDVNEPRLLYRVTVVDRDGIRWKGVATVLCRSFVRRAVELRLSRPRAIVRSVGRAAAILPQPLCDVDVDARAKPRLLSVQT